MYFNSTTSSMIKYLFHEGFREMSWTCQPVRVKKEKERKNLNQNVLDFFQFRPYEQGFRRFFDPEF